MNISELINLYHECNEKYFNNSLPKEVDIYFDFKPKSDFIAKYTYYRINPMFTFNSAVDFSDYNFTRNIMVHEMIHCYFRNDFKVGHGIKFREMVDYLNNSFPELKVSYIATEYKINENLIMSKLLEKANKLKEYIIVEYIKNDNRLFQVFNIKCKDEIKSLSNRFKSYTLKYYISNHVYFSTFQEKRKIDGKGFQGTVISGESMIKMFNENCIEF